MTTLKTLQDNRIGSTVFYPRPDMPFGKIAKGAKDLMFEVERGVRLRLRVYRGQQTAPNILFFHGNGETARDYDSLADKYRALPANFAVAEYRGYGTSTGTPSIYTFLEDANATLNEFLKILSEEDRSGPLIIMGRSIGSAPAIDVTRNRKDVVSGLIIESGFARIVPLLELLGIQARSLGITEEYGPQNELKMADLRLPTLFIHAEDDEIIPILEAERMFAQCRDSGKEFFRVPKAGHNDLQEKSGQSYFDQIRDFLERVKREAVSAD